MFPQPGGVAAALGLVVGKGFDAADQQARVAVGAQRCVNFVHIAFAGFGGQPLNQFARKHRIHLGGLRVFIPVNEDDVQVAAVAQLFAAPFAVADDAETRCFAVPVFQALPHPLRGDLHHGVSQRAQVISDLLYR